MAKYTAQEIIQMIDEEDVKFIRLQFVDFFGELKNIAITAGQIGKALAGFAAGVMIAASVSSFACSQ